MRYENYAGTNGPDLRVCLADDLNATNFVDLGRAKGNKGNINYSIPDEVDVADYKYVLTWCRAFSALFRRIRHRLCATSAHSRTILVFILITTRKDENQ